MRTKRNTKKGFTLVEVIVVLVILAILAAIMIPSMTGWIDKAKQRRLVVGCRTCVTAAQTLVAEQYGVDQTRSAPATADVKELAGVPGEVSGISLNDTAPQVHFLTYTEGEDSVTYDADACDTGEYYNFGKGKVLTTGTMADHIGNIIPVMNQFTSGSTDSGAAAVYSESNAAQLEAALKLLGIDLKDLGANAWQYTVGAGGKNPRFYWTNADISNYKPGDTVLVMRYNPDTGNCNLWEANIAVKTHPNNSSAVYNVLQVSESNAAHVSVASYGGLTETTYAQMVADYNRLSQQDKYQPSA